MKTKKIAAVVVAVFLTSPLIAASNPLEKQILRLHPQADKNGDGKLSEAEEATLNKLILKRFPEADKDGDGVLSIKEQQAVIRQAAAPEGKVYVYKKVDGVNREMEIYFPEGHAARLCRKRSEDLCLSPGLCKRSFATSHFPHPGDTSA